MSGQVGNPYHDAQGKFSFGGGGGKSGSFSQLLTFGKMKKSSLPKNQKKVSISQAATALSKKGFKMSPVGFDMVQKKAIYDLRDAGGNVRRVTSDEIKRMIYEK